MSETLLSPSSSAGAAAAAPPPLYSLRARALRVFAYFAIALGAFALLDAGVTLVWQEPFSALYAKFRQDNLAGTLRQIERAPPTLLERRALASIPDESRRIAFLASELRAHSGDGSPVGRIVIPQIGASYVVVKGTDTQDLESGPGVYSDTSFPGVAGTTAIAGHRTTYLAPFRNINLLHPGNRILVNMPYAHLTYTVTSQRVVKPTDVQAAISQVGYPRLVLSACTPLFSAAKRLLVYARLTRMVPAGDARTLPGNPMIQPIEVPGQRRAAPPKPQKRSEPVFEPLQSNAATPSV